MRITVSQPGMIAMPRAAKAGAAVAGALGEGRKADAEMAALRARFLLPLRGTPARRWLRPPSPASLCSSPRRKSGPWRRCREICRSGCGGGCRPGRWRSGGRLVHQPFQRESDHRPRHAAIGRHGAGVGEHAARAAFVVLHVVGARAFPPSPSAARRRRWWESRNRRRHWRRRRP